MRLFWLFFYLSTITPLLAQKQWIVDPDLTSITFTIKNFGINVEGTLAGLKAEVYFDPQLWNSSYFQASVEVPTINTNNKKRDKHLRSEDYFDIEQFARITFESTEVLQNVNGFMAKGNLRIKNVIKQIELPFTFSEHEGKGHFKSQFNLNRLDFGVGKSSWVLGDEVRVIIEVVAHHSQDR